MKRTRSITARLAGVFLLLFLTVALLGTFSIVSLSSFDRLSSRVRDEWLPATGLLGDLNNHTSDFRGLEAAVLLATPEDRPRATRDIEELDTDEAAATLGVTPNALKIRLQRARQALCTLLEREISAVEIQPGMGSSAA